MWIRTVPCEVGARAVVPFKQTEFLFVHSTPLSAVIFLPVCYKQGQGKLKQRLEN